MREWTPHEDFSPYLIPGSPGHVPPEYEVECETDKISARRLFLPVRVITQATIAEAKAKVAKAKARAAKAKAAKARGKAAKAAKAAAKVAAVEAAAAKVEAKAAKAAEAAKKRENSPRIHLDYPLAPISTDPELKEFLSSCERAARRLRLVTARGTYKTSDFLRFAGAFASMNPDLWKDILFAEPGRGDKIKSEDLAAAKTTDTWLKVWRKLATDLKILCDRHPTDESTIIRAAAAWLFHKIDHVVSDKLPTDMQAVAFVERFTSGRNIAEAKNFWNDVNRDFDEEHAEIEWVSGTEREMELQMVWDEKMAAWQAKRMEILIWPGKIPRKKSA